MSRLTQPGRHRTSFPAGSRSLPEQRTGRRGQDAGTQRRKAGSAGQQRNAAVGTRCATTGDPGARRIPAHRHRRRGRARHGAGDRGRRTGLDILTKQAPGDRHPTTLHRRTGPRMLAGGREKEHVDPGFAADRPGPFGRRLRAALADRARRRRISSEASAERQGRHETSAPLSRHKEQRARRRGLRE